MSIPKPHRRGPPATSGRRAGAGVWGQEHGGRAREGMQTWGKCVFSVYLGVFLIATSISLATRDGGEKESVGGVDITLVVDSLAEAFLCIWLSSAEECSRGASVYSV